MHRELRRQFGHPRSAEILERLRPRLQSGPINDPRQLRSQVHIAVAGDGVPIMNGSRRFIVTLLPQSQLAW